MPGICGIAIEKFSVYNNGRLLGTFYAAEFNWRMGLWLDVPKGFEAYNVSRRWSRNNSKIYWERVKTPSKQNLIPHGGDFTHGRCFPDCVTEKQTAQLDRK